MPDNQPIDDFLQRANSLFDKFEPKFNGRPTLSQYVAPPESPPHAVIDALYVCSGKSANIKIMTSALLEVTDFWAERDTFVSFGAVGRANWSIDIRVEDFNTYVKPWIDHQIAVSKHRCFPVHPFATGLTTTTGDPVE